MRTTAQVVVLLCWWAVFAAWAQQWRTARRGRSETGRQVNQTARAGMLLEAVAFLLVFTLPRGVPVVPAWAYIASPMIAIVSALLGWRAGVHLGRELRIQAVVTAEHKLITTGPYRAMRHPIYACLLGFLLASGLAFSSFEVLLLALPVFLLGTEIRVRAEDKLLAERFGQQFHEYKQRVSAYLPGIR